jgi:hypothetical protein
VAQGRKPLQGRRRFITAKVGCAYRYDIESKGRDMTIFGKTSAILALAAMSIATMPAEAQWHGPRHRGHDHVDGGDVLLGALLAGGLFAILSSGKHKQPAPPPEPIDAADDQPPPPAAIGPDAGGANGTPPRARTDEEAAVDACVANATVSKTNPISSFFIRRSFFMDVWVHSPAYGHPERSACAEPTTRLPHLPVSTCRARATLPN